MLVCAETPEVRTQVFMHVDGAMEVYDNVPLEAKAAKSGGAVSLPSKIDCHLPGVVFCSRVYQGR